MMSHLLSHRASHPTRGLALLVAAVCLSLLSVACEPLPPSRELTAAEIHLRSAEEMSKLRSLHFRLEVVNGTMSLGGNLAASRIEGDTVAPDRLQMAVKAKLGNTPVELQAVVVGPKQYLTNPLNRQWQEVSGSMAAPAILDPERGIGAALRRVEGAARLGRESVDGVEGFHLKGTVPTEALAALVGAKAARGDPVAIELWVDSKEFLLRRAKLVGAIVADESQFLERILEFSDFDRSVTIEEPIP